MMSNMAYFIESIQEIEEDFKKKIDALKVEIERSFCALIDKNADIEAALSQAIYILKNPKFAGRKQMEENIKENLRKNQGKTSLKWDWYLEDGEND